MRHGDRGIALRVERAGAHGRPIAGVARPARGVALARLRLARVTRGQDRVIVAGMTLCRADVADAAVAVLDVVPAHEVRRPGPRLVQIDEALGREIRPVLGGAEQRLREGVVVAHARARVRGLDAQPVQHRQHRRRLERGAVVAVKHRLVGQRRDATCVVGGRVAFGAFARPRRAA